MNLTPHASIPGLYNAWDGEIFSTILAMNLPEGRVWRTNAYREATFESMCYLGDFATRDEAVKAVEAWAGAGQECDVPFCVLGRGHGTTLAQSEDRHVDATGTVFARSGQIVHTHHDALTD